MTEFLASLGLEVLNEGTTPTFFTLRGGRTYKSIVDVTFCSGAIHGSISGWRVDPDLVTLSDHRGIQFELEITKSITKEVSRTSTRRFNTAKARWSEFVNFFRDELQRKEISEGKVTSLEEEEDLENAVRAYVECVITSCEKAIPEISKTVKSCKTEWWTQDLSNKKKTMIRLRNKIGKSNPRRRPIVVREYLAALEDYKLHMLQAITTSWKAFCTRQERESMWQSIYRITIKCTKRNDDKLLRCPINNRILSPADSAELLARTFFPHDDYATDSDTQRAIREDVSRLLQRVGSGHEPNTAPFMHHEIRSVLNHMSPKKAPGGDGLTADICQKTYQGEADLLLAIYNKCLHMGYFPKIWKTAVVKVIPKPNKDDYAVPKSYRPIGLLPIFGKVLEKLFANRILWQLGKEGSLSPYQYGFMPQRSTEDALYDAVGIIREAFNNKRLAVAVSLDVEGAFDNAWWPAILHQLLKKNVDRSLIDLVASYLHDRGVTVRYAGEESVRATNKGCIQGSTCGPLLWNIMLDGLLEQTRHLPVHMQAFADDVLLIGTGKEGKIIEENLNVALTVISRWGKANKLKFAPHKTQITKFTRILKYHTPELTMDGVPLPYDDDMKVLGLTLDKNLNFVKHTERVAAKACNIYRLVSRAARANWGLNQEIRRSIYISVVEPTILYAANVWADKSQTVQVRKKLDQVTRLFGIMISRAHKTTSLTSSVMLARILPLDLRAEEKRSLYMLRKGEAFPHLPGRDLEVPVSPFDLPHTSKRTSIEFGLINNVEDVESISGDEIQIYTDGSKIEGKVGAAVTFWVEEREVRHTLLPLASYCSVFQAELCAILGAVQIMLKATKFRNAKLYSDSRSALESIADPNALHPIVAEIHHEMENLRKAGGEVKLYWIRAHVGIPGNERADELAKLAARKCKKRPVYDRYPTSYAKRLLRTATVEHWQRRYSESMTGEVTKMFFPQVQEAYKALKSIQTMNNTLAQLFTGHGGFRVYLHRFKLAPSPFCVCDNITMETVEHVLTECPRFGTERLDCSLRMDRVINKASLSSLLNEECSRAVFLKFAERVVRKTARANGSKI